MSRAVVDVMGQTLDIMRFVRYKRFLIFDFLRLSRKFYPSNFIHRKAFLLRIVQSLESPLGGSVRRSSVINFFYYILQFFTNTKNNDHG
jgi:hypothetical protein